jgi:hypothetical protein
MHYDGPMTKMRIADRGRGIGTTTSVNTISYNLIDKLERTHKEAAG